MTGHRLRVLVVEDDPDLVLIMQHELTLAGHEVLVANSGTEALALAGKVDLVLLDFHLPGANGLDVMRQLQALHDPPSVVMITGDDLGGLDDEAMRAGAVDFVPKRPGYLRALPGIVQRAARQHDLGRRVQDLEAVALNLLAAETPEEAVNEILHGACRMLRGQQAVLMSVGEDPEVFGQVGGALEHAEKLLAMDVDELPAPGRAVAHEVDDMLIRLPGGSGNGVLLVAGLASGGQTRGELDLAQAFGRVAATALQSARRRREQHEVLLALRNSTSEGAVHHGMALSSLQQQLQMADAELAEVLSAGELTPELLRRLARAEAHVAGARRAADGLLGPTPEG